MSFKLTYTGKNGFVLAYTATDGTSQTVARFARRPAAADIRAALAAAINADTDRAILTGYTWDGTTVWLSTENQFNYKAAYDLAVQTDGATLPVTIKIGDDTAPRYVTFTDLATLRDFYHGAVAHIQSTLAKGWDAKDAATEWVDSVTEKE